MSVNWFLVPETCQVYVAKQHLSPLVGWLAFADAVGKLMEWGFLQGITLHVSFG